MYLIFTYNFNGKYLYANGELKHHEFMSSAIEIKIKL